MTPAEIRLAEFEQLFDDTVAFWRSWLSRSTYTGSWREALHRSAITLKLRRPVLRGDALTGEQIGNSRRRSPTSR